MGEFLVTCINKRDHKSAHQRIGYVGNPQGKWRIAEDSAIQRIKSGSDSFYTLVNGRRAEVVVATHNRKEYLKTTADGYSPDNLLNMGECVNCKTV